MEIPKHPSSVARGPSWTQAGPGPIIDGQAEGIVTAQGNNPVSGSIADVAPLVTTPNYSGDPNVIYVAATNGGVWKTTNALAEVPFWVPLTDLTLPSLSLSSLAISPVETDAIFAGAGRVSSYMGDGGEQFGIARSTDAGMTWILARAPLAGQDIRRIVTTVASGGDVVIAGATTGIYRSTDGGATFGPVAAGVAAGNLTDLVGDPGIANRFYAAIDGVIYITNNFGETWAPATGAGFDVIAGSRILLSVHNDPANDIVYAMVISDGHLRNVYRSADQGDHWTSLGVPLPEIFPGGQGDIHGAIIADEIDANTVYISGDRQHGDLPDDSWSPGGVNANGAKDYSGNVFRNVSGSWQNMVMNGANGTSPHGDSRGLAFDANGDIIYICDGGIFKLSNINTEISRTWASLNGNLNATEAHSAAFDPLSRIIFSGNQDTGTSDQTSPGAAIWEDFLVGDGGNVAVDSDQAAHPGTSIRYSNFTNLDFFNRASWNEANEIVGDATPIGLNIISGPGSGQNLRNFESHLPFYCPYVLNRLQLGRLLIGTRYLYESFDRGDSLANLGSTRGPVGDELGNNPICYGGRNKDSTANPGAFFVGAGRNIWHRSSDTGSIVSIRSPGTRIRAVVMNPRDVTHVFVIDAHSRVFSSFTSGNTWAELTANLGSLTKSVRTIEIVSSNAIGVVLIVGGDGGVWQMPCPGIPGMIWTAVASGLPHALVYDLRYDHEHDLLIAGTLGRGVWVLTNFFREGVATQLLPAPQLQPRPARPRIIAGAPLVPSKVARRVNE